MLHYDFAQDGASDLFDCHQRVLGLEPESNGLRTVLDEILLRSVYEAGNKMVSNAVRAVQHLAEEIETVHHDDLSSETVEKRISEACKLFGMDRYAADADYAGLGEINGVRDALEHPTPQYTNDPEAWDRNPLSWMLSDRSLLAWKRFHVWFSTISGDWEAYRLSLEHPGTVEVQRGLESLWPVKKPPAVTE
jgi:hypothetical protein